MSARLRRFDSLLKLLILSLLLCLIRTQAQAQSPVQFTPGQYWISGFGAPKTAFAGDIDGDGKADLLGVDLNTGGSADIARTSNLSKPLFPNQSTLKSSGALLAIGVAPFTQRDRSEVIVLSREGSIRLARSYSLETHQFLNDSLLADLPKSFSLIPPVLSACGDFDGDQRQDWLLLDHAGKALLVQNQTVPGGVPQFIVRPVRGGLPKVRQLISSNFPGESRSEAVFLDENGALSRMKLTITGKEISTGKIVKITTAAPEDKLVSGHFSGADRQDILIGRRLLVGGSPNTEVSQANFPGSKEIQSDVRWLVGDVDGDGKDDLIRIRRSEDRSVGEEVVVHFSRPDGKAPWNENVVKDGLLDIWKRGEVRPGGLNLKALGCSSGHRDVIVEVQRMEDVSEETLHAEIEKAVRYFASLPIENPDRRNGIALHVIYREPISLKEGNLPWWTLGEKYHPISHRGITHWMLVGSGGGGQSADMSDRGSCGVQALYATFLHEFGHQLGLDHTGRWGPVWCPTYPSLMNYAYNYQLEGSMEKIGYSDGRLAKVVLNERKLSERLPVPKAKVEFLAGPPYYYRLKASDNGQETLIDWNWNGIFGEEGVSADINYGYSTQAGTRHTLGKTYVSPDLATFGKGKNEKLFLFNGRLSSKTPVPLANEKATSPSLSPAQPGGLIVRSWLGSNPEKEGDNWASEIEVEGEGVTGDPSACSLDGVVWVSYPTLTGVCVRSVVLDASGKLTIGAKNMIPDSTGVSPTLAKLKDDLALVLWRSDATLLGFRLLKVEPGSGTQSAERTLKPGAERVLPVTSVFPPGLAEGDDRGDATSIWLGLSTNQIGRRRARWQIRSFDLKGERFEQTSSDWIGGEQGTEQGSGRIRILREANPAMGATGQIFFFQCGLFGGSPWACHYVASRIADRKTHGGWQVRRYYDEWTQSRSAPGVCFFQGDIAFALRWFGNVRGSENDNCMVGFFGRGIESELMGDFDDISFIRDIGLSHSISSAGE